MPPKAAPKLVDLTIELPDELAAKFDAWLAEKGMTFDTFAHSAIEDALLEAREPTPQVGRPLWDVLPRIDRLIRDEVPYTEELFIALMKELDWSRGSPELEIQAEVWQIAWCEGKKLLPLDTFARGCCARDREDWEASLPKITLPDLG